MRRAVSSPSSSIEAALALVERHLGRVDDHVGLLEVGHLEQLGIGEGGLRRAAPAEDHDLA